MLGGNLRRFYESHDDEGSFTPGEDPAPRHAPQLLPTPRKTPASGLGRRLSPSMVHLTSNGKLLPQRTSAGYTPFPQEELRAPPPQRKRTRQVALPFRRSHGCRQLRPDPGSTLRHARPPLKEGAAGPGAGSGRERCGGGR